MRFLIETRLTEFTWLIEEPEDHVQNARASIFHGLAVVGGDGLTVTIVG